MTTSGLTLITGVSGFLGSRVAQRLISAKKRVLGIDLNPPLNTPYPVIRCDISNRSDLHNSLSTKKIDTVVHLAALHYIPDCESRPDVTYRTNVLGTRNILDLSDINGIDSFIFASSADVYSPSLQAHTEYDALDSPTVYGRSKIMGETLMQDWFESSTDKTVHILRLFNLIGHGDRVNHLVPSLIRRMHEGKKVIVGNLHAQRDYVSVDDVASLIANLDYHKKYNIVNIGNGIGYSGFEIFEELSRQLGGGHVPILKPELVRKNDRAALVANREKLDLYNPEFPRRSLAELIASALDPRID